MIAEERLFLTADKDAVVPESDPRAAFLFAAPGDEISDEDAETFGLAKPKAKPAAKEADPPADKQAPAPANKGRRKG